MRVRRISEVLPHLSYRSSADAPSRRDIRLDLLRGFCVFVMVADHIGGERSWLYVVTGGNRFFTSAAEGFVLISGIVMGAVYLNVIRQEGLGAMLRKVLQRGWFLYLLTVGLTLTFAALSRLMDTPWSHEMARARPLEFALGVLTLHRSYALTDVLMLYTLLVFAAPPMLYLLATGRARLVLFGAWALWFLWQISPEEVQFPWAVADGGFPFAAWQVLFATGVLIGWHRRQIAERLTRLTRTAIVAAGSAVAIAFIVGFQSAIADRASTDPSSLAWLLSSELIFGKNDLRPGRVIALVCVAILLYFLVTIAWVPFKRALGWLLLPLGQRALGAYSLHLLVVAFSATAGADLLRIGGDNTILQIVGIGLIWLALPLLPWLGRVEHLASRTAPLVHPLAHFVGVHPARADAG